MNELSIKQLLWAGGPVMLPIIVCSITALTIIIKKWRHWVNIQSGFNNLQSETFKLIRENKIKAAVNLCETNSSPAAHVLKAGLLKFGCPLNEIKEAVNHATDLEIPKLEQGLVPLITIANTAPLFGILGTIVGITIIFQTMQNQSLGLYTITTADLFGGIWQALLTTIAGLVVAIPTFVAYNYFLNSLNNYLNDLNRLSQELINLLTWFNESTLQHKPNHLE